MIKKIIKEFYTHRGSNFGFSHSKEERQKLFVVSNQRGHLARDLEFGDKMFKFSTFTKRCAKIDT